MLGVSTLILTPSGGAGEPGSPKECSQERWICGKGQCEFPFLKVLSSGQTTFSCLSQNMINHDPFELNNIFRSLLHDLSSLCDHSQKIDVCLFCNCSLSNTCRFFINNLVLSNGYCNLSRFSFISRRRLRSSLSVLWTPERCSSSERGE